MEILIGEYFLITSSNVDYCIIFLFNMIRRQLAIPSTLFILDWICEICLHLNPHKNIERRTAHIIYSWPNPKQWMIVHTSDLIMIMRQGVYILSIITRGIGKLKTHSPIYCLMDKWENMLNLTHTLDKIESDRHFISSMSLDRFAQSWWWDGVMYKQTNMICKPERIRLFALIRFCAK